ncbi:hypothetical protein G6L13_31130 [Agrobacterium tumefaciens]|uniref:hypothetical protein n=1 Tax=Agrobacterium tumefaciens TaxID=358 RepID=UPI001571B354|nr:hypothetical protein [Agrobacterium tumefaciens]NTA84900.1 hypothetical protein [Agrobacterium tumefaciens]
MDETGYTEEELVLRDRFAENALLLSGSLFPAQDGKNAALSMRYERELMNRALWAYAQADCMLMARKMPVPRTVKEWD